MPRAGTNRVDRDRIFQAYSALVLATLFYVFNPPLLDVVDQTEQVKITKVQLQAGGYFFAFIAFAIAMRFLLARRNEDVSQTEYSVTRIALFGFLGMFLGITLVYMGILFPNFANQLSQFGLGVILIGAFFTALMIGFYIAAFLFQIFGTRLRR